jgi:ketosteroid isomerase-like protein
LADKSLGKVVTCKEEGASMEDADQQITRLSTEWIDALKRRDSGTLARIMADDFIFTYPMDGDSKDQFIADVEAGDLMVENLSRSRVEVNVFGPTAVLTAIDDATWRYHGHEIVGSYRIINVYSLRDERWQLVAVQACPITPK